MVKNCTKKILICKYCFWPINNPRSLRWKNLIEKLTEKGWEIDVLTTYPNKINRNNLKWSDKFSSKVKIFLSHAGPFNYFFRKLLNRMGKGFLFSTFEWFLFGLYKGLKILKNNHYDILISVSHPFTPSFICYFLKKFFGLLWIADFGDPWAYNPVLKQGRFLMKIKRKIEGMILKDVDYLIVTTKTTKDLYLSMYPFLSSDKIGIISQGYSEQEFTEIQAEFSEKFRIVYIGTLYKSYNPLLFFPALCKARIPIQRLEVIMVGNIEKEYRDFTNQIGLSDVVKFMGLVSHVKAISFQKGASVLLLFGCKGGYQIHSKIYEYIAAERPIIVIKYDNKDLAAAFIQNLKRGIIVSNNIEQIASAVTDLYNLWEKNRLDQRFSLRRIPDYTWNNLANKFENIFNNLSSNNLII